MTPDLKSFKKVLSSCIAFNYKRKIKKTLKWQSKALAQVKDSIKVLEENLQELPRKIFHQYQLRVTVYTVEFYMEFRSQWIGLMKKRRLKEEIEWDEIEKLEEISRLTFQKGVELERALLHASMQHECRHLMQTGFTYFIPLC